MKIVLFALLLSSTFCTAQGDTTKKASKKVNKETTGALKETNTCTDPTLGCIIVGNKLADDSPEAIVFRIPKAPGTTPSKYEDFFYIKVHHKQTSAIQELDEGTYEFETRVLDPGYPNGWSPTARKLKSGFIQVEKNKPQTITIRY
jgi:hypothetical protein